MRRPWRGLSERAISEQESLREIKASCGLSLFCAHAIRTWASVELEIGNFECFDSTGFSAKMKAWDGYAEVPFLAHSHLHYLYTYKCLSYARGYSPVIYTLSRLLLVPIFRSYNKSLQLSRYSNMADAIKKRVLSMVGDLSAPAYDKVAHWVGYNTSCPTLHHGFADAQPPLCVFIV